MFSISGKIHVWILSLLMIGSILLHVQSSHAQEDLVALHDSTITFRNEDLEKYDLFIHLLEEKAEEESSIKFLARAYKEKGFSYNLKLQNDSAIYWLTRAKKMFDQLGLQYENLETYIFLGLSYKENQDVFTAISTYREALKLCEKLKEWNTYYSTNNLIANIYMEGGEYDEAFKYFQKGRLPEINTNSQKELAGWWNQNIGEYYNKTDQPALAKQHFLQALRYWDELNLNRAKGYAYNSLSELCITSYDKDCEIYLDSALAINKALNNSSQVVRAYNNLGRYARKMSRPVKEIANFYQCALIVSKQHDLNHLYIEASDYLLKRPRSFQSSSLSYDDVLEIHMSGLASKDNAFKRKDIKLSDAIQQLELSVEEGKKNEATIRTYQIVSALILLFLMSSGFFLWKLAKVNRNLHHANEKIAEQYVLIESQAEELHSLNQVLESSNESLKGDLQHHTLKLSHSKEIIAQLEIAAEQRDLKSINAILRSQFSDDYWQEKDLIRRYYDKGFLEKLVSINDNLTKREITICCMIREGLSIKEISNITTSSVGAIKVARSRIRKKLFLDKSDELSSYLVTM